LSIARGRCRWLNSTLPVRRLLQASEAWPCSALMGWRCTGRVLEGGAIRLPNPWLLCEPGWVNITDPNAGNVFSTQEYSLWTDSHNPYGSTVKLHYSAAFPFVYTPFPTANEAFLAFADNNPLLDRPVTVTGLPFDISSKDSAVIVAVNKVSRLLYLYDDNILFDNYDPNKFKRDTRAATRARSA